MELEITPAAVKAKRDAREHFVLLDVREPWEFEIAQLAESKLIPMNQVPLRAAQELDPNQHIVVMCHHGVRSMHVTLWMRQHGFERAQSMAGGIDAWSRTVDGQVPVY